MYNLIKKKFSVQHSVRLDPCRRIDTKTELTASDFDSTLC